MTGFRGALIFDPRFRQTGGFPDDEGKRAEGWLEARLEQGRVYLAQRLLAQVPEGAEINSCHRRGPLTVVADVRLDNREELASVLCLDQSERTSSDEEYLLLAYQRWGKDAARHLRGDFVFAIWDASQKLLYLARDPMGVASLYYFETSEGLYFSTSLRELKTHTLAPKKVCEEQIANFLSFHFENTTSTFYEGIVRLAPGHFMQVQASCQKERYFTLDLPEQLHLKDHREYSERFIDILQEAVRVRLRSPDDPALFLSGGLDSSLLFGIIKKQLGASRLSTYSALFPSYPEIDEKNWIDEVLAGTQAQAHFVSVDRELPLSSISGDIEVQGQPFYSPNNYVDRALLDAAQKAGSHLLLDGLDGDTSVGHGWEFLADLFREGRWRRLYRIARQLSENTDRSLWFFLQRHVLLPTWSSVIDLHMPGPLPDLGIIAPHFAERMGLYDEVRERRLKAAQTRLLSFRERHHRKVTSGLLPLSFEIAREQAKSRGMVRRHPYFDQRLVEFCLSLPPEQRLDRGADRLVQRRAAGGFVPESIRRRLTKSIWEQNFRDRVRTDDREMLRNAPLRFGPLVDEYVDGDRLKHCVFRALSGSAAQSELAQIWMACSLGLWLAPVD